MKAKYFTYDPEYDPDIDWTEAVRCPGCSDPILEGDLVMWDAEHEGVRHQRCEEE